MKQENKSWRMSRKYFYYKLDLFLDDQLDKLIEEIESIEPYKRNKDKKLILDKCKSLKKTHIKLDMNHSVKMSIRKEKMKTISKNVTEWQSFSTNQESLDDIMFRLIAQEKFDCNLICLSYICKFSILPEEFIDDMIFVTSGLFSFTKWDDAHVNNLVSCLEEDNFDKEDFHKLYPSADTKNVGEKIDWFEIHTNQNISDEFKKSHWSFFERNVKCKYLYSTEEEFDD